MHAIKLNPRNSSEGKMVSNTTCVPDTEGYVTLASILTTYNAPINEDHAWALCHLCAKYLQSGNNNMSSAITALKADLEIVKINTAGHVKLNIIPVDEAEDPNGLWVAQAISKVAVVIYQALDYGIPDEEERSLSLELENILYKMVSAEDEGNGFDLEEIIKTCSLRNLSGEEDDTYVDLFYQEACKSLVVDALEISKFVDITEQATQALRNLYACEHWDPNDLVDVTENYEPKSPPSPIDKTPKFYTKQNDFKIVAKVWIQVVRELKQGVTLKKLDSPESRSSSIEKQLQCIRTPHDLLMDDIKLHRFHLHKASNNKVKTSPR